MHIYIYIYITESLAVQLKHIIKQLESNIKYFLSHVIINFKRDTCTQVLILALAWGFIICGMRWIFRCFNIAPAQPQEPRHELNALASACRIRWGFLPQESQEDPAERKGLVCKCLISLAPGLLPGSDWFPSDFYWAWGQDLFLY